MRIFSRLLLNGFLMAFLCTAATASEKPCGIFNALKSAQLTCLPSKSTWSSWRLYKEFTACAPEHALSKKNAFKTKIPQSTASNAPTGPLGRFHALATNPFPGHMEDSVKTLVSRYESILNTATAKHPVPEIKTLFDQEIEPMASSLLASAYCPIKQLEAKKLNDYFDNTDQSLLTNEFLADNLIRYSSLSEKIIQELEKRNEHIQLSRIAMCVNTLLPLASGANDNSPWNEERRKLGNRIAEALKQEFTVPLANALVTKRYVNIEDFLMGHKLTWWLPQDMPRMYGTKWRHLDKSFFTGFPGYLLLQNFLWACARESESFSSYSSDFSGFSWSRKIDIFQNGVIAAYQDILRKNPELLTTTLNKTFGEEKRKLKNNGEISITLPNQSVLLNLLNNTNLFDQKIASSYDNITLLLINDMISRACRYYKSKHFHKPLELLVHAVARTAWINNDARDKFLANPLIPKKLIPPFEERDEHQNEEPFPSLEQLEERKKAAQELSLQKMPKKKSSGILQTNTTGRKEYIFK